MTVAHLIYEDRCPKCRALARCARFLSNTFGWGPWVGAVLVALVVVLVTRAPLSSVFWLALFFLGVFMVAPKSRWLDFVPWVRAGSLLRPFGEGGHGWMGGEEYGPPGGPRVCLECTGAPVYRATAETRALHLTHRTLPHNFYLLVGDMLYGGRSALVRLLWHLL